MFATLALIVALAAADPPPAAGVTTADPAQTQSPQPAAPKKPKPKDDPNRVICEETPSIGSTIPRRVCRTKAEWDRRAHDDQQEMRRVQDAGGVIVE